MLLWLSLELQRLSLELLFVVVEKIDIRSSRFEVVNSALLVIIVVLGLFGVH
jgi:hypothetical protein